MEATIDTTEVRRWKRYDEYQSTDIPWHEEIPSHWEAMRFKYGISFQEGPGIMASDFRTEGVPLLRIRNITQGEVELADCNYLEAERVNEKWSHFRVQKGDLLISCSATTGIVSSVGEVAVGAVPYTGIIRLWPRDNRTVPEFIRYLVVSEGYKGQIDLQKTGSTIQHYGPIHLGRVMSAFPPLAEQKAIAAFLDQETARIDALIGHKERLIALLEEKRQAVISHAVTRGLDTDAKMKDSKIEFIGEIPEHWTLTTLGRFTVSRCDGPFGSGLKSAHYTDEGVRVIRLQNIGDASFKDGDSAFISRSYYDEELGDHDVRAGDVLIAGLGDEAHPVGRACVAPSGIEPAMVKADCFRFRVKSEQLNPDFVACFLTSTARNANGYNATGSTRLRMNLSSTSERPLVVPPIDEQHEIMKSVREQTSAIRQTIPAIEASIERLQEYSTALISAAVTGQIDVREEVSA